MMQFVSELYPNATAEYRLINRGKHDFSAINNEMFMAVRALSHYEFLSEEIEYLRSTGLFSEAFLDMLRGFRLDARNVEIDSQGNITVRGLWFKTIMWEVPLMACASELALSNVNINLCKIIRAAEQKAKTLLDNGCKFIDFGTRRRRSLKVHESIVSAIKNYSSFIGTSNPMIAKENGIKCYGTMAHELIQAMSVIGSLRSPNAFTMEKWAQIYRGKLGIALTDTFTSDAFFREFDLFFAKLYDGVRQDSGDPLQFARKAVAHYQKLGIDPSHKTIVFSDSLNVDKCIEIQKLCNELGIKCVFGIGTNLCNDVPGSPALNFVIKLWKINGIPVVKLSDDKGKESGEKQAVQIMKQIFTQES